MVAAVPHLASSSDARCGRLAAVGERLSRLGQRITIGELTQHAEGLVKQNQLTHHHSLPDLMLECRAVAPIKTAPLQVVAVAVRPH